MIRLMVSAALLLPATLAAQDTVRVARRLRQGGVDEAVRLAGVQHELRPLVRLELDGKPHAVPARVARQVDHHGVRCLGGVSLYGRPTSRPRRKRAALCRDRKQG